MRLNFENILECQTKTKQLMVASDFKIKVLPISKKMLRYASFLLKSEEDGRDVVQDVFLKLWQKRGKLDKIENIEAYVMRMIHNKCLDFIRDKKMVSFDDETERKMKEEAYDSSLLTELTEAALLVKKLIQQLPETQRTIIELRDINQLSFEEISKITSLNINAIRVNLSRARKRVRDEFLKINSDGNEKNKTIAAALF